MKKTMALLLAVLLVVALAVPAFALESPGGKEVNKVHVVNGNGAKPEVEVTQKGDALEIKADEAKGTFDEWVIYLKDGKTKAVLGEHYTIVAGGSLEDPIIEIIPIVDLIITGNYNGEETEFEVTQNGEVTSPQTGDTTVVFLSAVMLAALAGMVALKKRAA